MSIVYFLRTCSYKMLTGVFLCLPVRGRRVQQMQRGSRGPGKRMVLEMVRVFWHTTRIGVMATFTPLPPSWEFMITR